MGNNARKYVDLMSRASGKHANWDPPKIVEVGDWGYVDKRTGEFVKEGNIFTDGACEDALRYIDKPILHGGPEDLIRFDAKAISTGGGDTALALGATGDIGVKIKASWTFSPKNRGAILTASDVSTAYFEPGIIFPRISSIPKFKDKAIVTETLNCSGYALLLTEKGVGGSASLSLETWISEAGLSVGPSIGGRWTHESSSGVWRSAYGYRINEKTMQQAAYTPLFVLRTTNKRLWPRYRGAAAPTSAQFEEYQLPWGTLDEDGEEVPDDAEDSPMSAMY